jgi:hypothetical protein
VRIKALDAVIALLAAGAVALAAFSAYGPGRGAAEAVIKGRDGEWIFPLGTDRIVPVEGPLGTTHVEIAGKDVRVEDSPCPNQTCVAAGAISKSGQWIACLPNEVFVRIDGGAEDARIDASAY